VILEMRCKKCGEEVFVDVNPIGRGLLRCDCGHRELMVVNASKSYEAMIDETLVHTA